MKTGISQSLQNLRGSIWILEFIWLFKHHSGDITGHIPIANDGHFTNLWQIEFIRLHSIVKGPVVPIYNFPGWENVFRRVFTCKTKVSVTYCAIGKDYSRVLFLQLLYWNIYAPTDWFFLSNPNISEEFNPILLQHGIKIIFNFLHCLMIGSYSSSNKAKWVRIAIIYVNSTIVS